MRVAIDLLTFPETLVVGLVRESVQRILVPRSPLPHALCPQTADLHPPFFRHAPSMQNSNFKARRLAHLTHQRCCGPRLWAVFKAAKAQGFLAFTE